MLWEAPGEKCGFDFPEQPEAELRPRPDLVGLPLCFPRAWGAPILRSRHWSGGLVHQRYYPNWPRPQTEPESAVRDQLAMIKITKELE